MNSRLLIISTVLLAFGCSEPTPETTANVSEADSRPQGAAVMTEEGVYQVRTEEVVLTADPETGGRIEQISLGDYDFLTGTDVNQDNWGSTFWPSPQSAWGWPPSSTLDTEEYTASISGDTLYMGSGVDPTLQYQFEKEIYPGPNGALSVRYTIKNAGAGDSEVAPWEITRVRPGGITFYPSGEGQPRGLLTGLVEEQDGIVWFDYDSETIPEGVPKLLADGREGWLAQVNDGYLLVKSFQDISIEETAPEEGEIELYANPDNTYIEIEQQGPYEVIPGGGESVWTVDWYLVKLPEDVEPRAGNPELVSFVRDLVGE